MGSRSSVEPLICLGDSSKLFHSQLWHETIKEAILETSMVCNPLLPPNPAATTKPTCNSAMADGGRGRGEGRIGERSQTTPTIGSLNNHPCSPQWVLRSNNSSMGMVSKVLPHGCSRVNSLAPSHSNNSGVEVSNHGLALPHH